MPKPNAADNTLDTTLGDQDLDPGVADDTNQGIADGTELTGTQPDAEIRAQLAKAQEELDRVRKESNEWRDRFTGMQGKYQQEKKRWEASAGDMANLPTQLAEIQSQMDVLQNQYSDAQTHLLAVQTEKEIAEQSLERKNIIFKEFPGLIAFEADGLLPDGTGEDLKLKLSAFAEKMTKLGGEQFANLISGSNIPKPTPTPETPASINSEMLKAFNEGNMDAYNVLYGKQITLDNGKE